MTITEYVATTARAFMAAEIAMAAAALHVPPNNRRTLAVSRLQSCNHRRETNE